MANNEACTFTQPLWADFSIFGPGDVQENCENSTNVRSEGEDCDNQDQTAESAKCEQSSSKLNGQKVSAKETAKKALPRRKKDGDKTPTSAPSNQAELGGRKRLRSETPTNADKEETENDGVSAELQRLQQCGKGTDSSGGKKKLKAAAVSTASSSVKGGGKTSSSAPPPSPLPGISAGGGGGAFKRLRCERNRRKEEGQSFGGDRDPQNQPSGGVASTPSSTDGAPPAGAESNATESGLASPSPSQSPLSPLLGANSCSSADNESGAPNSSARRIVGTDLQKLDREHTKFSDSNEFHPHEIVVVPRSQERLHYAKIIKVSPETLTMILGFGDSGVPLTKNLPRVLVGKLPASQILKEEKPAAKAKSIILTLENLYAYMKAHPPVTAASFVGAVGIETAGGAVKKEAAPDTWSSAVKRPGVETASCDGPRPPLSPALYDHCLFLLAYHARCLYYCCKLFECKIKTLSRPERESKDNDFTELPDGTEAELYKRIAALGKENKQLRLESKLSTNLKETIRDDVPEESTEERLLAQHRAALRQKDEIIRKLQKRLRDKDRRHSERVEELRQKIDDVFAAELKEEDANIL